MRILDRYVLQKFLLPFIYCFFGFIAIWFIFDLSDNLQDFLQGKLLGSPEGFSTLLTYYKSQIPEIIVLIAPIGVLLSLLYSLTAMSRSNEIISMLGAGVSVTRIIVPLLVVGLLLVGLTAYFNYESAPHAALIKRDLLREIKRGRKLETGLSGHLYRNREDMRTWYIRKISADQQRISDIQIIQQDKDDNIIKQWYARDLTYDPVTTDWHLRNAKLVELDIKGNITKSEMKDEIVISGWKESPWRIASSVMKPQYLSVRELEDYLDFNKDFPTKRLAPYRTQLQYLWAVPWGCFLAVLIAAPLGIIYSRRGIIGAVALAIVLFFSLFFFSSVFVALGKGSRISPFVAVWVPLIVYFGVGIWLLWFRSTNRDFPKIKLPWT